MSLFSVFFSPQAITETTTLHSTHSATGEQCHSKMHTSGNQMGVAGEEPLGSADWVDQLSTDYAESSDHHTLTRGSSR